MKTVIKAMAFTGLMTFSVAATATHNPYTCGNEPVEVVRQSTAMEIVAVKDFGPNDQDVQVYELTAKIMTGSNKCLAKGNTAQLVVLKNENNELEVTAEVINENPNRTCTREYLPEFATVKTIIEADYEIQDVILNDVIIVDGDEPSAVSILDFLNAI